MVVAAAVKPAGGFVLPEEIVRVSDLVTTTKPTEGLTLPEAQGYFNMVVLTAEGRVRSDRALFLHIKELEAFHTYCQQVHVFSTGGPVDEYDFYYDEIRDSVNQNPWVHRTWFTDHFHRWVELLPRPSTTMPGLVAYFQSPEKRARNIRTPIKPGRFLKKFFGDVLTEPQIHELALDWSNSFDTKKARFTQDANEIEEIFTGGPNSCMSGKFGKQPHPSRVYAGPDLGVAYLGPTNSPAARAVVWPAKKIYGCPYGDTSRLRAALEAEGYRPGSNSSFAGARLRRIEWEDSLVLPYLDIASSADDHGDYIVIGRGGDLPTGSTDGVVDAGPQYRCDDCNEGIDEEERNYISSCERDVCDHCYSKSYFYCNGSNESYEDSERAELAEGCFDAYSKTFVDRSSDWFYCENTEVYYPIAEYHPVETYEGETIANTVAERKGFFCEHVGQWTLETDAQVKLTNGKSVHMDTFLNEAAFNEWLLDNGAIVGDPDLISPDQIPLPLSEAA